MVELPTTPHQTIGPFFAVLRPLAGHELVPLGTPGAIVVEGQVFDGTGEPVTDAMIEIWQANPAGRYAHPEDHGYDADDTPGFTGFGRDYTSADGAFSFVTLKPGPAPGCDERRQAPHLNVSIFARGLLRGLTTRMYFPDEPHANERDAVLASVDQAFRGLLVAEEAGAGRLRFVIRLQGERETPFFAV